MEQKNRIFLISGIIISLGFFMGCLNVHFMPLDILKNLQYSLQNAVPTLFSTIIDGPLFVFMVVLFGFFMLGFVFIFPIIFYKAYCVGICATLFYTIYGIKGLLYVVSTVFPCAAIIFLLLILSGSESFCFSLKNLFGGEKKEVIHRTGHQLILGSVFIICSFFSVVWGMYLNPYIIKVLQVGFE